MAGPCAPPTSPRLPATLREIGRVPARRGDFEGQRSVPAQLRAHLHRCAAGPAGARHTVVIPGGRRRIRPIWVTIREGAAAGRLHPQGGAGFSAPATTLLQAWPATDRAPRHRHRRLDHTTPGWRVRRRPRVADPSATRRRDRAAGRGTGPEPDRQLQQPCPGGAGPQTAAASRSISASPREQRPKIAGARWAAGARGADLVVTTGGASVGGPRSGPLRPSATTAWRFDFLVRSRWRPGQAADVRPASATTPDARPARQPGLDQWCAAGLVPAGRPCTRCRAAVAPDTRNHHDARAATCRPMTGAKGLLCGARIETQWKRLRCHGRSRRRTGSMLSLLAAGRNGAGDPPAPGPGRRPAGDTVEAELFADGI